MKNFYVYVLKSEQHDKTYVGMSENVNERLREHNTGKSTFTKSFRPWILLYSEYVGEATEARKLEKYYKSTAGKNRLRKNGIL